MRCSVSQAWICDRVGSTASARFCGTAAISAAAPPVVGILPPRRLDRDTRLWRVSGGERHAEDQLLKRTKTKLRLAVPSCHGRR